MIVDFVVPFLAILLAEFGDKTQIAVLSMASRTKKQLMLFIGVLLAFIVVDGLAIYFGKVIVDFVPSFWAKIVSGSLFVLFGLWGFIEHKKEEKEDVSLENKRIGNPLIAGFVLIFFAEFGDKSQIASAVFASSYHAGFVFLGVICALALLSMIAIFVGRIIFEKFDKRIVEKVANSVFVLIGVLTLVTVFV